MKSMVETFIGSRAPIERLKAELESLIPWFKKHGKGVLKNVTDEILMDILQNCFLKSYKRDELIITQGEMGDSFYIVVHGEVSIYVNDKNESLLELPYKTNPVICNQESRHIFGKCVITEDAGYSFGEYALLDENSVRKASVIATTETLLLVTNKEKYDESLKKIQQNLISEREQFINQNLLFSDCNGKIKKMLLMSLEKLIIPVNTNLVTQGQDWNGLIFITKGSGQLFIDPTKHEVKFPEFFPLDFNIYDKRYQEFPELKPHVTSYKTEYVEDLMPRHIRLKRAGKYSDLETNFLNRKNLVCSVQSGEVVGDMEFLFNLQYYLSTIVSTEEIEAFFLHTTNIERVLKKLNQNVLHDNLKNIIQSKMNYREKHFRDIPIPLLMFLKYKLYDKKIEHIRYLPKLKTEKSLPHEGLEWQHLLKMFTKHKAALCKPYVKGGIFLKDLMNKNANDRRNIKLGNSERLNEIEIQPKGEIINSQFPITQSVIYKMQKLEPNSLRFLELLYNQFQKIKKTAGKDNLESVTNKISSSDMLNRENSIQIERCDEKIEESTKKVYSNNSTPASEKSYVTGNLHENSYSKYKKNGGQENCSSNEYLTSLQRSEIQFLNSLCSEKSNYSIKTNSGLEIAISNKRTHYLPRLKCHNKETILNGNIPKRGARVLVKKRRCFALNVSYKLVNHVHNHFYLVKTLKWKHV